MNCVKLCLLLVGLLVSSLGWSESNDYEQVMQELIARGDKVVADYRPEQSITAGNKLSDLYFGGFEGKGLEFAVGQADQQAMLEIELSFSRLINAVVTGRSHAELSEIWSELRSELTAAPMIDNQEAGFWGIAIQALLILLREGVEALLVVAALIAYLRKAGAADRVPLIWAGVVAALLASVATAWVLRNLIESSGAAKETIEGATMLVAALLLAYVSFWLFSRREMKQWQGFIHDKLGSAVSGGSLLAIVMVAFFAVYREGAETILFYQALIADVGGQFEPVATGFGIALLLLGFVYLLIFQLSVTLPLKLFFTASATLLFGLAIIFAGKSVLELQIAGWLPSTHVDVVPTIGWLGVFPNAQSLGLQSLLLIVPLLLWIVSRFKRQVTPSS